MTNFIPNYHEGEQLRKDKNFKEALIHFETLWKESPDPDIGWRYAHCLRKLALLDDALSVAREVADKFPEHNFCRNEVVWAIYDKEIKPAKDDSDLGRITQSASEILKLTEESLPRSKAILAVIKVAKAHGKWNAVLEWANLIEPDKLEKTPYRSGSGNPLMSDREIWYIAKTRALLELGHYEEIKGLVEIGLIDYPDEFYLKRTAALASAKLGDLQGGYQALVDIQHHARADWYIFSEIGEIEFERENYKEALHWLIKAMNKSAPLKNKVSAIMLISQTAIKLGEIELALDHIQLAFALREKEGWTIKESDRQIEQQLFQTLLSNGVKIQSHERKMRQLEDACRKHWGVVLTEGKKRLTGVVKQISTDKPFTFITPDNMNEDIYAKVSDIPASCRFSGARVGFYLEESFDKKKNRKAFKANTISCL